MSKSFGCRVLTNFILTSRQRPANRILNSSIIMGKPRNAISPTREENYPEWYQQVVKSADMAENTPVRGCMVIKPWGYGIWENIRDVLDSKFKQSGHQNAYFPLFIPKSFLQREAEHIDGFAKECAVVTHSRLEADEEDMTSKEIKMLRQIMGKRKQTSQQTRASDVQDIEDEIEDLADAFMMGNLADLFADED